MGHSVPVGNRQWLLAKWKQFWSYKKEKLGLTATDFLTYFTHWSYSFTEGSLNWVLERNCSSHTFCTDHIKSDL